MPTGTQAAVGGKVAAALTNQFGDFPSAVAEISDTNNRSITSATYANIPTTSLAVSLVLTRTTLVQVTFGGTIALGSPATPTNWMAISFALSGSVTRAATDVGAYRGASPGQLAAGTSSYTFVAPAGTITATLQARYGVSSGVTLYNHLIQLVALRLA